MMETTIIGGMFGLPEMPDPAATPPPFMDELSLLLYNARCGIRVLIDHLRPRKTWMPSYLCPDMLRAVDTSQTALRYYEIDHALCLAGDEWIRDVEPGDLVLYIDYFGFPFNTGYGAMGECRRKGAIILRDAAQALLSHSDDVADFTLYSPRKYVGVPDGGVLTAFGRALPDVALSPPPPEWVMKTMEAAILRREFDRQGGARRWFAMFQQHEPAYPIGPYAMSEMARTLLVGGIDYAMIARRRRENYAALAETLEEWAVYPALPPGVVPMGFPVRIAERDRVRRALFAQEIYPPVHWGIDGSVPVEFEESHRLSREVMTLPCDQRYGPADLKRLAGSFRDTLGH